MGGRVLDDESKALENEMTQTLKNDSVGVTLSFDGWTNVLNQNLLERWKEVIEKTETLFKEIDKMGVNLIAVVTDSAPSYAAARYVFIDFKKYLFMLYY